MIICKKCGHQILDDSTFCIYCGTHLKQVVVSEPELVQTTINELKCKNTNLNMLNNNKKPIILLVLLMVMLIGIIVFFIFSNNKEEVEHAELNDTEATSTSELSNNREEMISKQDDGWDYFYAELHYGDVISIDEANAWVKDNPGEYMVAAKKEEDYVVLYVSSNPSQRYSLGYKDTQGRYWFLVSGIDRPETKTIRLSAVNDDLLVMFGKPDVQIMECSRDSFPYYVSPIIVLVDENNAAIVSYVGKGEGYAFPIENYIDYEGSQEDKRGFLDDINITQINGYSIEEILNNSSSNSAEIDGSIGVLLPRPTDGERGGMETSMPGVRAYLYQRYGEDATVEDSFFGYLGDNPISFQVRKVLFGLEESETPYILKNEETEYGYDILAHARDMYLERIASCSFNESQIYLEEYTFQSNQSWIEGLATSTVFSEGRSWVTIRSGDIDYYSLIDETGTCLFYNPIDRWNVTTMRDGYSVMYIHSRLFAQEKQYGAIVIIDKDGEITYQNTSCEYDYLGHANGCFLIGRQEKSFDGGDAYYLAVINEKGETVYDFNYDVGYSSDAVKNMSRYLGEGYFIFNNQIYDSTRGVLLSTPNLNYYDDKTYKLALGTNIFSDGVLFLTAIDNMTPAYSFNAIMNAEENHQSDGDLILHEYYTEASSEGYSFVRRGAFQEGLIYGSVEQSSGLHRTEYYGFFDRNGKMVISLDEYLQLGYSIDVSPFSSGYSSLILNGNEVYFTLIDKNGSRAYEPILIPSKDKSKILGSSNGYILVKGLQNEEDEVLINRSGQTVPLGTTQDISELKDGVIDGHIGGGYYFDDERDVFFSLDGKNIIWAVTVPYE